MGEREELPPNLAAVVKKRQEKILEWLVGVPVGDSNFKTNLDNASATTIATALIQIEALPNVATKQKALEAAYKKAVKRELDPVSEAALEVVEREQGREVDAKAEQADRERRIAECHEVIGRIQGVQMLAKFGDVTNLVWLRDMKEAKIYRELPGIGTWENFCKYIGLDRHTVDQNLLNLAAFGEEFLVTATKMRVGFRDLRKLRQLTHDGSMVVEAEAVVIGGERIPFDSAHREDLQEAFEKLIEAKDQVIHEKDATLRVNKKLLDSKDDLIKRQEKDLGRYEREAKAKGLTPAEDAFCQKCDNARTTIDGFLNQFDPSINPLPEDATPRMQQTYMHTLAWFKRCILASYDTAAAVYGDTEMDSDGWVPPHLRAKTAEAEG